MRVALGHHASDFAVIVIVVADRGGVNACVSNVPPRAIPRWRVSRTGKFWIPLILPHQNAAVDERFTAVPCASAYRHTACDIGDRPAFDTSLTARLTLQSPRRSSVVSFSRASRRGKNDQAS